MGFLCRSTLISEKKTLNGKGNLRFFAIFLSEIAVEACSFLQVFHWKSIGNCLFRLVLTPKN